MFKKLLILSHKLFYRFNFIKAILFNLIIYLYSAVFVSWPLFFIKNFNDLIELLFNYRYNNAMIITVLKSKISYATITHTELYYVGSITIDEDLMNEANIRENERVQVVNLNNGERLETYVIGPTWVENNWFKRPSGKKGDHW